MNIRSNAIFDIFEYSMHKQYFANIPVNKACIRLKKKKVLKSSLHWVSRLVVQYMRLRISSFVLFILFSYLSAKYILIDSTSLLAIDVEVDKLWVVEEEVVPNQAMTKCTKNQHIFPLGYQG